MTTPLHFAALRTHYVQKRIGVGAIEQPSSKCYGIRVLRWVGLHGPSSSENSLALGALAGLAPERTVRVMEERYSRFPANPA